MPPRLYLLHGPDEFGSAEFLQALQAKMGDPSIASLNTTVFDGKTVTLPELRGACDAMPFLAERRLVIVDAWLTRLAGRGEADADEVEAAPTAVRETLAALVDYLPGLPETTALVMVEKRALPPRHPVLKAAAAGDWALVKFFDLPKGDALAGWIRARARQAGGEFTRAAAQALASAEGEPRALDHEIRKLLTYVDFARPVEAADVELLTPAGGEARIFDLVDAMGERQARRAARELHRLLDQDEPLRILAMIVRQFRLILQAREMLEARAGAADVAQALKLHAFVAEKVCAQARNFPLEGLERVYRRLLDYDTDIKTSQVDASAALDMLVASLTAV